MRIVYVAYDRFPSSKGAAVHIDAFVSALASSFGHVDLVTVPNDTFAGGQIETRPYALGVTHTAIPVFGRNVIERALHFRRQLLHWWPARVDVAHVRSIFEGFPIAREKQRFCRQLVFEVNGLPSIELKYHYPDVADDRELLKKLRYQEDTCLAAADRVLTVSGVNAAYLVSRGVPRQKIRVIHNGVDTNLFTFRHARPGCDHLKLLYCGTLAAWQGVQLAMEALALYRRDFSAALTVVGEARNRQLRDLERQARRLDIAGHFQLLPPCSQQELAALHHRHDVVLAPLRGNDRNLLQGCCPLKVLEAMSSGTPLISSDIPVVSELATNGRHAVMVKPGSAKAIKDGLLRLHGDPHFAGQLSAASRRHVLQHFTWQHAQGKLRQEYDSLTQIR